MVSCRFIWPSAADFPGRRGDQASRNYGKRPFWELNPRELLEKLLEGIQPSQISALEPSRFLFGNVIFLMKIRPYSLQKYRFHFTIHRVSVKNIHEY